jgi:hypothetical protein
MSAPFEIKGYGDHKIAVQVHLQHLIKATMDEVDTDSENEDLQTFALLVIAYQLHIAEDNRKPFHYVISDCLRNFVDRFSNSLRRFK